MLIYRLFSASNLPIIFALMLLLGSVLLPRFDLEREVYEIQVTFDISQSMNVRDVRLNHTELSRLALARAAAGSLLRSLPCGSRIGWSVFAGHRTITLMTPLDVCLHFDGLLAALEQIDGRMRWIEASSIGKGIHQSMRAAQSIGDEVAMVFITDGHEAPPLREGQRGMPLTDRLNIDGLVVGVGGTTPVRIPKMDAMGRITGYWQANEVIQRPNVAKHQSHEELSRLHEEYLIKLARLANLNYVTLDSEQALGDAIKKSRFLTIKSTGLELHWIPALLALLLLSWRFLPRWADSMSS